MFEEFINIAASAKLNLPALEVMILLGALALCLMCRLNRIGLIVAFLFLYKWAWGIVASQGSAYVGTYIVFGILVAVLTIVGFLTPRANE